MGRGMGILVDSTLAEQAGGAGWRGRGGGRVEGVSRGPSAGKSRSLCFSCIVKSDAYGG